MFRYVLVCFVMFCYVLLLLFCTVFVMFCYVFAMFCYDLLCVCMFLLCLAMFCYVVGLFQLPLFFPLFGGLGGAGLFLGPCGRAAGCF